MAEGDVELGPVDIDHTVQLLLKYEEEVQNPSNQRSGSISMVPSVFRDLSPHSFTPRVVSIGPLHHHDENLKGFEVQKATHMHFLFHNILSPLDSTPEQILKECVRKVSDSVDQIKACYFAMPTYSDSELVKMMVTDACFILAFLYNRDIRYSSFGPIELPHTQIIRDMVLIENQIPFFVLQEIFDCTFLKLLPNLTLVDFFFGVAAFCCIFEGVLEMTNDSISSTHDHILGFCHKSYQHPDRNSRPCIMVQGYSVAELDTSGVTFSKNRYAKWPMAMELEFSRLLCFPLSWSKPTLKMPVLLLLDVTESIIRNLIIYEQSSQVQNCVTSYMFAMDMLIDIPEDVAMLTKSQVLVNGLGSDEKAANLIKSMFKEVPIRGFYYEDEWQQLDEHYNSKWQKMMRTYFSNPWSIIGLLSGIVLFVLTVVQTVLTAVQTVYAVKAA